MYISTFMMVNVTNITKLIWGSKFSLEAIHVLPWFQNYYYHVILLIDMSHL